ncbi:tetratricopeptide repeat protein [uncultured Aquimarina sp.]|uniref:tetratricopeptide repeat protein n=1 Tax=uncultured Aquimarina sp. TaxID=575652 RepID=UPI00260D8848|nr:tetratricopeptide repeat protein [uncultured Aquimarina sp.]
MRHLLFLIFIIINSGIYSQNTKVDSLRLKLNSHTSEDTKKVDLLNETGFEYWIIDPNESLKYGKEALELSKKLTYDAGIAVANRIIGVAYWAQGNQNEALLYLTQSQKKFQNNKDQEGIANTMLNIGMVYADLKEYDKALKNYNDAIDNFTALNLSGRIATTFTKIGTIHIEKGNLNDARIYISDALKLHTKNNFQYGIAEAHNRLGILYLKEKELAQAKYHIERSISVGKKIGDEDGMISNLIQYGKLLRLENNFEAADIHLNLGLNRAKNNSLKKYELLAYEELKELRTLQEKPKEALVFYDFYSNLKDSIFNTEKSKQIAYLEFKNQLEQQDKELEFLQEKEKTDVLIKWSLAFGILVLLISSFLILTNVKQRSRKNRELLEKSNELLQSKEALNQQALENAKLKQQELKQQLEFKNKELTSYAINFVQKNELLQNLQSTAQLAKKSTPKEKDKLIDQLNKTIQQNLSIDKDWEDFKRFFEEVHVGFYTKLKAKHPELSANDLKICSLTRLNLNIKETASILGISPESAKTARYRLRKKLELHQNQEIFTYLLALENE